MSASGGSTNAGVPGVRRYAVRSYNQRMAGRIARRAHLNEQGVAVAVTCNNLLTTVLTGPLEDVAQFSPSIGGLVEFAVGGVPSYFHLIWLVADQNLHGY